ncbi:hypothetical protein G7054_g1994 [Neopestalotiopsis clavispora]|nr:hypothetical protein G7054_g1994 [Neopestalotiopsis clavispora]
MTQQLTGGFARFLDTEIEARLTHSLQFIDAVVSTSRSLHKDFIRNYDLNYRAFLALEAYVDEGMQLVKESNKPPGAHINTVIQKLALAVSRAGEWQDDLNAEHRGYWFRLRGMREHCFQRKNLIANVAIPSLVNDLVAFIGEQHDDPYYTRFRALADSLRLLARNQEDMIQQLDALLDGRLRVREPRLSHDCYYESVPIDAEADSETVNDIYDKYERIASEASCQGLIARKRVESKMAELREELARRQGQNELRQDVVVLESLSVALDSRSFVGDDDDDNDDDSDDYSDDSDDSNDSDDDEDDD